VASSDVDPIIAAHREWIGYVQPVGLLVAPAALAHRGIVPDRNIADVQKELDLLTLATSPNPTSEDQRAIGDFPEFATSFLGWDACDIVGTAGSRELPQDLGTDLPEYGERLAPTFAIPASGNAAGWQMLIRVEEDNTDLDVASEDDGRRWAASPHVRFERLLRDTGVPIGLQTNKRAFRLIYAPKGETSGFATFDLASMLEVAGRPMLSAFHMLLNVNRLFGSVEKTLPSLLAESRLYQETVSAQLAEQVLVSLNELLRGFYAADLRTQRSLTVGLAASDPEHLYSGLLTALMRLVFVLYAEDRDLFTRDEVWEQNYSLGGLFERLRSDAALYPDTMDERYGAWAHLLVLWRLVYGGGRHGSVECVARRGRLFDPDRFLFLEGRASREVSDIPAVSDGVVWKILQGLMVVDGERLSYRTLDVEQIGSVYQSIMGFTIELTRGTSIAIRSQKASGASAVINLDSILAESPAKRAELIRKLTDRKVTASVSAAVKVASRVDELEAALAGVIDARITPRPLPAGVPVLQPTQSRRRSGSHYTPRSLTAPIVTETLRPILGRLGSDATAEDILGLRVADPALGSGAFLVEVCRQLGERLTQAWEHDGSMPTIPPDEDALLHARRLVAQRCLYGVDRNPMAADLAKLSLWLVTLAKEHEFTFLDHVIRHGDALVGLFRDEIARLSWDSGKSQTFAATMVNDHLRRAEIERTQIRLAPEETGERELRLLLESADTYLADIVLIGDALLTAFFSGDSAKSRTKARNAVVEALGLADSGWRERLRSSLDALRPYEGMPIPFHWELQFPEVFLRENPGFDVIVGNPPFMGGTMISSAFGASYLRWLLTIHSGAKNRCDLVAHFFRRCFRLLRDGGCLGLVATKTIAQGDTRESGLLAIARSGGQIYAAIKRVKWPGEAAVTVSVVHVAKNAAFIAPSLNGTPVASISCYLVNGTVNDSPARLASSVYCSNGSKIYGQGFLFDDEDAEASPIALMEEVIRLRPDLRDRIYPYIGGEEINSEAIPQPHRYVIYLSDIQTEPELAAVEALAVIVRERVKPIRERLGSDPNAATLKKKWWAYQAHRPTLYKRIREKRWVLCQSQTSKHLAFTFCPTTWIFSHAVNIFDTESFWVFSLLQSRVHEVWARFFGSSLEDRLRYTPSDVFETFPFPVSVLSHARLDDVGRRYFEYRGALAVSTSHGLTDIYNRFNDPTDWSSDIEQLRGLHADMDRAVLDAYGWSDINADLVFEPEWIEGDGTGPLRYQWPEETRDMVLARLLELNGERAREEVRLGLSSGAPATFLSAEEDSLALTDTRDDLV
jgi:N-6 DNA Methylase